MPGALQQPEQHTRQQPPPPQSQQPDSGFSEEQGREQREEKDMQHQQELPSAAQEQQQEGQALKPPPQLREHEAAGFTIDESDLARRGAFLRALGAGEDDTLEYSQIGKGEPMSDSFFGGVG